MSNIDYFLDEYTEEQKKDFYNFYEDFKNYFGNDIGEFINIEDGYDAWFIREVIFPEREKILKEKITKIYKSSGTLLPEVIEELTEDTMEMLNHFYKSNKDYKVKAFNAVVNSIFVEHNFRGRYSLPDPPYINPNYIVERLIKNKREFKDYLSHYNWLVYKESDPTYLDLYRSGVLFRKLSIPVTASKIFIRIRNFYKKLF